ncbi:MAG: carbohydrate-binding family 9-like protein [Niastella sp.]|uniref:carbohydrate-binding family 9-like protein n=1 Tax=Niastella sp. TaxID=1869183 RepID=UPI003899CA3C
MKLSDFILTATFLLFVIRADAQTYTVKRIPGNTMKITGRGDNKAWQKATVLTDFTFPWEPDKAPATSFSALWDGEWLYCLYQATDDSIITPVIKNNKIDAGASDRVEIFMTRDTSLLPYYCLEMDATGRTLDYRASFYRKMDYAWSWPAKQYFIKTSATNTGYIVEIAISIQSLNELRLLQKHRMLAGLFRAERKTAQGGYNAFHWISWVKPNSTQPDFHTPSAFGVLVLE